MAINKVEFGDEVLIDLTEDTVTEDTLLEGETAHDASGNPIRGRAKIDTTEVSTTDLSNSAEGNIRSLHLLGRGRKSKNLLTNNMISNTVTTATINSNGIIETGYDNTSGTDTKWISAYFQDYQNFKPNHSYKIVVDIIEVTKCYYGFVSTPQLEPKGIFDTVIGTNKKGKTVFSLNTISDFTGCTVVARSFFSINKGDNGSAKIRVSIYDADDVASLTDEEIMELPYEPYGLITSDGVVESANADNTHTSTINASEILDSTFTGVNDIKDELIVNADGSGKFIKRVGKVDLGTLGWSYNASTYRFGAVVPQIVNVGKKSVAHTILCGKYVSSTSIGANITTQILEYDKKIGQYEDSVFIRDYDYTDKDTLKSAMNGEMLYYELATPIKTDLTPSQVSALLSLKTFTDNTTITSDCDYEIGYFKNNEIGQSVADVDVKVNNVASVIADNGDWLKGKNLLNPTLQTTTFNGVTCTNNGDGTYTLNGTATANATFTMFNGETTGTYRIVGCPSGGSTSLYAIGVQIDEQWVGNKYDVGNGSTFSVENKLGIVLFVAKDKTVNNLLFKPMLVDADLYPDVTYDDFVPYIKSNVELTSDVAKLTPNLITGWTYNTDKITYIGSTNVIQIGKIVIVTFNIGIGTALSNNDIILSGLPKAKYRSLGVLANAQNKNIVATIKPNETVIKVDIASDATSFTEGQLVYITE